MSEHTPKPWKRKGLAVYAAHEGVFDEVICACGGKHAIANANLISAAPDLLKACQNLLNILQEVTDNDGASQMWKAYYRGHDDVVGARAAIAKAMGETL